MRHESTFTMPALGADMEKATVVHWLVQPGDIVHRGQIIVQIETDKGLIDVETFEDGRVDALLAPEGTVAKVGAPLANIVSAEEAAGRVRASPLAKARAKELGVDLSGVRPARGDRILREDVERAAAVRPAAPSPGATPHAGAEARATYPAPADRTSREQAPRAQASEERASQASKELDASVAMRRAIAAAMSRSKREVPHYYLQQTIDLSMSLAWLTSANETRPVASRLLLAVLFARAVARAAAEHPEVNGHFVEGAYRRSDRVHLSFAVAMRGGGLIAPAIFDADKKSLDELMHDIADLTQRVRAGGVRASELSEGTITLTSLGDRGVESLAPIIQPPQVAIVGVGTQSIRPWVVDGVVMARPLVTLTFAGDHRVSDGISGARFLKDVEHLLMHPEEP